MFTNQTGRGVCVAIATIAVVFTPAVSARQVGPPDYGIDFVTIGAVGNAPFPGPDPTGFGGSVGRGRVDYEYRIGRFEITTSQWLQFVNTFSTQGDEHTLFAAPSHWGAFPDPEYNGPGRRWILSGAPQADMQPVYGITWREAAMYCNWLHNGQQTTFASIQDGAYDTSTFAFNPNGTFTDQRTHHPDARFWIPTFDEWIKAAHYDPNRFGEGEEGWWIYSHRSDDPPIPGPPGEGETSAGYRLPQFGHFDIPLGAYPTTLSPWGLLDTTGGAAEWTEETFEELYGERRIRWADGTWAGTPNLNPDRVYSGATWVPTIEGTIVGLRIATVIPSPPSAFVWMLCWTLFSRRRREQCYETGGHVGHSGGSGRAERGTWTVQC